MYPYFPFLSISKGPPLQSVLTIGVAYNKDSTKTFPKPSNFDESTKMEVLLKVFLILYSLYI